MALSPQTYWDVLIWIPPFVVGLVAIAVFIAKSRNLSPKAQIIRFQPEHFFHDPQKNEDTAFPAITDPATLGLSVVIPAYKETARLPGMLDECIEYLENRRKTTQLTYEIIVVDDGSGDDTSKVALDYSRRLSAERLRVLTLLQNRGKGGAIRLGVLSCRGKLILFADADGATRFSDLANLEKSLKDTAGDAVVIGSRAHLEDKALAERSFFRNLLMWAFKGFVYVAGVKGLKDTQCGFKLFTRGAALKCFLNLHVERWAFDVELLYIAAKLGFKIREVAVKWQEMEGSKLIPIFSWLQMATDIARMRLNHMFGIWQIDRVVE